MKIFSDAWIHSLLYLGIFCLFSYSQIIQPDPDLPSYKLKPGIMGTVTSYGSDTMNNLMALWLEEFRKLYPLIDIQLEGKGSLTAPPALIEGMAQFGLMSRLMTTRELEAFRSKYQFDPVAIRTAMDALAIYVHRDNPLNCISLEELDAVFSKTRKRGYPENIVLWGQLGLGGIWVDKPISIYGRNTASGTYGVFKIEDLKRGDFKDEVKEQPGSASVVQSITHDMYGIGYSGIGYRTADVKVLQLSEKKGSDCIAVNYENVVNRRYPFSRYLYIYFIRPPRKELDPLISEFLKFILSQEGQRMVIQAGYFPISQDIARQDSRLLEK